MSDYTVRISKEVQFDAGHRVPKHVSKCKNPHGHRYRLIAHCEGPIIEDPMHPEEGMLVDFGRLKAMLNNFHDMFDHGFIIHDQDKVMLKWFDDPATRLFKLIVFPYVPTAENIARYVYDELQGLITEEFGNNLWLSHIEVWETPTSQAVYPA